MRAYHASTSCLSPQKSFALRTSPCASGIRACRVASPCQRLIRGRADRLTSHSTASTVTLEDRHDGERQTQRGEVDRSHAADYVIIGSGIGGLCCAALLAKYGYKVTVCESHYLAGGAAHSFQVKGYNFDSGPSFFLGISGERGKSPNPLKQVLDAVGERVECAQYNQWVCHTPEGKFPCIANRDAYCAMVERMGGPEALNEFKQLEKDMAPLQKGASLFPAAAIRSDPGVALTSARFLGWELAQTAFVASKLGGPFSAVVDPVVKDPWLRSFLDLECFVLSGMLASDTLTAEMAFMFLERNSGRSAIDYPMGGSKSIIDALVRGIQKHGGRVMLGAHVDRIVMEEGRAVGVMLRSPAASAAVASRAGIKPSAGASTAAAQPTTSGATGGLEFVRARRSVVSNASGVDTQKLLPRGAGGAEWATKAANTPQLDSFMHLHLGIDATGLPADLDCHHLLVNRWDDLAAEQNVTIVSIPTVFDPALAPPGKAVVHVYGAANEPYALWEGMDRKSDAYRELREQRSQFLWKGLERVIPDVRARCELQMVGTPLTHERFLRRHRGTYGPAISAGRPAMGGWPGSGPTPVPGLAVCGDSCMPGIGVPAAAASGMMCANSLVSVWKHLGMIDELIS